MYFNHSNDVGTVVECTEHIELTNSWETVTTSIPVSNSSYVNIMSHINLIRSYPRLPSMITTQAA